MSKFYTFPHWEINVKDESATTPLISELLALHVPLFLSFAERGRINQPVYGNIDDQRSEFGAGTFDVFSPYYRHPNLFVEKCLPYNNVFFVRLAADDAAYASLVLQCSIYHTTLIQYQKDSQGQRIVDNHGNPLPILDTNNDPVKEPGVVAKWSVRPVGPSEDPTALVEQTSVIPDPLGGPNITVSTYPVIAFKDDSPGASGNFSGFKFFWNSQSDTGVAAAMKALIYTFGMTTIKWGADTPSIIRTQYLDPDTEFTFATNTTDKNTMRRYYLNEAVSNDYAADNINFNMYTYPDNVALIGTACLGVESITNFPELTSPFMVNLFTGKTMAQQPYDHIMIDNASSDSALMNSSVIHYMTGGSDGDISDTKLESLTRDWLGGDVFPDILDQARYPITHLYDSGYEMATKEALIDFLGIRDDVKVVLSTQTVYAKPNTKPEDQSAGSFLRARALLLPESMVFGTPACRATIFQQCGKLNELTPYNKIVPMTLDCMVKKGIWQGATYFKGKPKGLPKSAVTVIKDISWFPVASDHKQLSWDNALNYCQYYDMTSVHYPDVIAVYPYLTSLLSDDIFVDELIYVKHIVRQQWAIFAGVDDPISQLISRIRDSSQKSIYAALGNFLKAVVNPYQTALDVQLGYSLTVEVAVYGTVPNRVWNVIVPVRRLAPATK